MDALVRMTPRPAIVIATGDLADCGLPANMGCCARILGRLPMPVYVIPGNHDRRAGGAPGLRRQRLPARDGQFLHYVVDRHPVRLIGLDSIVPGKGYGSICAERRAWLAARLAEAPEGPTVIFLHHPPFPTGLQQMDQIGCRDGAGPRAGDRALPQRAARAVRPPSPADPDRMGRHDRQRRHRRRRTR